MEVQLFVKGFLVYLMLLTYCVNLILIIPREKFHNDVKDFFLK